MSRLRSGVGWTGCRGTLSPAHTELQTRQIQRTTRYTAGSTSVHASSRTSITPQREERPVEARAVKDGEPKEDNGRIVCGLGILAVASLVTALTYYAAEPGDSFLLMWGPILIGCIQILRGWTRAAWGWRLGSIATVVLLLLFAVWTIRQVNDPTRYYNSAEERDCVSPIGLVVDCDEDDTQFKVVSTKRFPDDRTAYPPSYELDVCPGLFFYPTRQSWEQGDRLVLCVDGHARDLTGYYNQAQAGDCVNHSGLVVDCDADDARYEVVSTKRFLNDQTAYPDIEEFRVCTGLAMYPRPKSWEQGDRLVLCVE